MRRVGTLDTTRRLWPVGLPMGPWVVVAAVVGLLVLVALTATLSLQNAYAGRLPAGVTLMGVEVGGRTRAEAHGLLQAEQAALMARPVTLRADDLAWELSARDLGASIWVDAMLDAAFSGEARKNPVQQAADQWGAVLLGDRVQSAPLIRFDDRKMDQRLAALATTINRPVRDARLEVERGALDRVAVTVVPDQTGRRLLLTESAQSIRQAIDVGLPTEVTLPLLITPPTLTVADLTDAKFMAERIVAAPLQLSFQERAWPLTRHELASTLTFERGPGSAVRTAINLDPLTPALERISRDIDRPALNARFEWDGSSLRLIRDSQEGLGIGVDTIRAQVHAQIASDDRAIPLAVGNTRPSVASSDAGKIGIKELIREGRTFFAGSTPEKQHNIRLAASRINGAVVPPGATFSFNKEVGPTTLDSGFKTGWGITVAGNGAKTIPSVAGGICQVATTLFHPVFHAGYAIEERHAHLYWIASYGQPPLGMKGLDATVDEDYGLDLQFTNTTADYILIRSRAEGTSLVFGLYGTKPSWKVSVEGPNITNVVAADRTQVVEQTPSMPKGRTLQVEGAQDGFDVTVVRTVVQEDETRRLQLRTHYVPSRNVILTGTGPG